MPTAQATAANVLPQPIRAAGWWAAWVWERTLNSVYFGIFLMTSLAIYIAIGSGFVSLRAWMEMTDLQFFNWWPMRVLAGLLIVNLLTVSFSRIPFTLPRLGVWCIHIGIITLIFGLFAYFSQKTEGMTLINKGETVNWYYDVHERALYVAAGRRKATPIPLADLPRFDAYASELGNADYLDDRELKGLLPTIFDYDPAARAGRNKALHELLDLPGDEPISVDITAYYPYAVIGSTYEQSGGDLTGLRLTLREPDTRQSQQQWAVAEQPTHAFGTAAEEQVATVRLRHLHRSDELDGESLASAARAAHEISWHVGEHGSSDIPEGTLTLEPGQRVPLGDTGYEVEAVAFLPGFPLFGNGEPADVLELLVHPPADSPHGKTFRRYIIDGVGTQTDFVLDVEGAGPKGQRQTTPVDPNLHLHYALSDGLRLLPQPGEDERHTILTKPDVPGFWHLVTRNDMPARLESIPAGTLDLAINGEVVDPETGLRQPYSLELDVDRVDGVLRNEWVRIVPSEQRDRQAGEVGQFQVVGVRVSRGDWEQHLYVPFSVWPDQSAWQPAQVDVPGMEEPLRLQLGKTRHHLPARVKLEEFELVPYAGDFTPDSAMRDFRSHLTIEQIGGEPRKETVQLNYPIYFDVQLPGLVGAIWPDQSWLLFQSQWDMENQAFTVLGVANRPGINTMIAGCVLVVFGLMWAFYVKPVIIRRRKAAALSIHQKAHHGEHGEHGVLK